MPLAQGACKFNIELEFAVGEKVENDVLVEAMRAALQDHFKVLGKQRRPTKFLAEPSIEIKDVDWAPEPPETWKDVFNSQARQLMWGTCEKAAQAAVKAGYRFMAFNGKVFSLCSRRDTETDGGVLTRIRDTGLLEADLG
jgi:hypothetical protein